MHGYNCSGKKSPSMKKWKAQSDPPKEVSTVKTKQKNEWPVATPLFK